MFLERFSLVTFPFAKALPCGNVHLDRFLVHFLLCSAFSSTHPDSISVEVTIFVAWFKPLHQRHLEVLFFQPCHHTHISSCLDTEIRALPSTQSRGNTESDKHSHLCVPLLFSFFFLCFFTTFFFCFFVNFTYLYSFLICFLISSFSLSFSLFFIFVLLVSFFSLSFSLLLPLPLSQCCI